LNSGYPFFPGFLALQLEKKRPIAKMARWAIAGGAIKLSLPADSNNAAIMAHCW
jgi:hypothetical protein